MKKSETLISIIIPLFNEAGNIEWLYKDLKEQLKKTGYAYEIIYVNDGSLDNSRTILNSLAKTDPNIVVLHFSRNFGKEAATTAGLHQSRGDAVVIVDGDGQHPIELIHKFIESWEAGSKVVVGLRRANKKEGFKKRYGSKLFYGTLRIMGVPDVKPGVTDFRLVDRKVVETFNVLQERDRVTRALLDWVGYERTYIEFVANPRTQGEAAYTTRKLIRLAINGFVSNSFTPLYLAGYLGLVITFLSLVFGFFIVVEKYFLGDPFNINITGTALLATLIISLVGILLLCQGLLSIYIAHIYSEVKGRPLYIIDTKVGGIK